MTTGIIGAQGNFGSKLTKRLKNLRPKAVTILGTKNRTETAFVVKSSDILILTIPPSDIEEFFKDNASHLKSDVLIVSFIAHTKIETLKRLSKRNVIRAIADPWFLFSAFLKGKIKTPPALDFLSSRLSTHSSLLLKNDKEIDLFTIHFCYLFVVLLLYKNKTLKNISTHSKYLQSIFHVTNKELFACTPRGNPEKLLALLATKGGITETIYHQFLKNPDVPSEVIMRTVTKKFI